MRTTSLLIAASVLLGACRPGIQAPAAAAAHAGRPSATTTAFHDVEVKRHFLVSISETEVDRILILASEALFKVDGEGDVPADARIRRLGPVGTVATGGGVINTKSEFDALFSPQERGVRQVRVVRAINWCGGSGAAIGCADLTGYRIAVVRGTAAEEPLTWAHEFGHTIGLDHRDVRFALMHPTANVENRHLNGTEAVTYLKIAVATPVSGTLRR
jgi:hypothetical protein